VGFYLSAFSSSATAQSIAQSTSKFAVQGPAEDSGYAVIRDALNRPCLDADAISRRQTVNPDMVDHIVSIKNNCSKLIAVKVCYFKTDACKSFNLGGYQRHDVLLGAMSKVYQFRYSILQR